MAVPKRYKEYAQELGLVRYGPEIGALTALLKQAETTRKHSVAGARTGMLTIQNAADLARPEIRNVYGGAAKTATALNAVTDPALAALPADSPLRAAQAIEQQTTKDILAREKAAALTDLSNDRIGAAAGFAGARRQAWDAFRDTQSTVGARGLDIKRELGAYIASQISDQVSSAAEAKAAADKLTAQLTTSRGNAWIAAGIDPSTGQPIPGGRLDPDAPAKQPKPRKVTGADRTAASQFAKARGWINRLDNAKARAKVADPKARRHNIAELLLLGDKASGIPTIPETILSAALDMHFDKALSRVTVGKLHGQGYKVKYLPGAVTNAQVGQHPNLTPEQLAEQRAAGQPDWVRKLFAALGAIG
jgi:hypothetical protein